MARLEVRCCCDPTKVLGTIEHPKLQKVGDIWTIAWVELKAGYEPLGFKPTDSVLHRVTLTVSEVLDGDRMFPAVKNSDYPLEVLKRFPGFVANNVEPIHGKEG